MSIPAAKLQLPSPRRELVARARLTERLQLQPGSVPRLVLISAPAGFGKTTLITQWLSSDERDLRVAWLALDTADGDPHRFVTHLVAAIQRSSPLTGAEAVAMLDRDRTPAMDVVLSSLVNDLDELAGRTVIALDDYHVIDTPAIHDALTFLLDQLPPQVTVAITTRADPPFQLARLRSRGELLELRAGDLRFTTEEADSFLNQVMQLALEPAHVSALEDRTEGWVAGLQLAALSARGREVDSGAGGIDAFVDEFAGSHRFVLDYLVEEVLDNQPTAVRDFLLDTSVLHQLSGPLCEAVTGRPGGQSMLETLERANLFVIPLDHERTWYRYHHLFADALQSRLVAQSPDRASELLRAASHWSAERGMLPEAVTYAVASGDVERAADLIEVALPGLRKRREHQTLREWLLTLPDEVARQRPLLAATLAWARLSVGDLNGAQTWLDRAEQAIGSADPHPSPEFPASLADAADARREEVRMVPATIELYRAAIAQARGDVRTTAEHARKVVDLAGPDDHFARGGGAGFLGLAAWASGDLTIAVQTFGDAITSLHAAGDDADALGATVALGNMWMAQGRPDRAKAEYHRALAEAARVPRTAFGCTGDLHAGLADVLREQGDLAAAANHLNVARELGERESFIENRFRWHVSMAGVQQAHGDLAAAVQSLEEAGRLYLPGFFPDVRPLPAGVARLHIAQGRLAVASEWATAAGVTTSDPASYMREFDHLTLARLLIAQHRNGDDASSAGLSDAIGLLDRVLAAADAADRTGSTIEASLVRALAYDALGDVQAALDDLGVAMSLGVPVGFARLFLDEGAPVVRLLERAAKANHHAAHARTLAALTRVDASPPRPLLADDELTDRELDVLRLLASDLTGPEIARHLFVSVNTLRTHTKHIFTKLGVRTRRAAVSRARELELI